MENPTLEGSYEEAKKNAKEFYGKLERVWCPALGDYVFFNKSGFEHLVRKRGLPRPKSEQKRRFALLPHIESILKDPTVTVSHEEDNILHTTKIQGERALVPAVVTFRRIVAMRDDKLVKIVIRQINGREKHFFGAFEGKQKPTR